MLAAFEARGSRIEAARRIDSILEPVEMSMDRSLKSKASLARHRNVLSRAERLMALSELDRWTEEASVFGLPKVAHRKVVVGGKKKEKKGTETEEAVAGEEKKPE